MQKKNDTTNYKKQKQNDVAYKCIVVKNSSQVEHLQKVRMWWPKQLNAWKNVNNLQKQMRMLKKDLWSTSMLSRRQMKDKMNTNGDYKKGKKL